MTLPAVQDVLQASYEAYADPRVAAAVAVGQQESDALRAQVSALQALVSQDEAKIAAEQQQLAAAQSDLAAAMASGQANAAQIAQLQQQVAALQAQLLAAVPGKAPPPPAGWVEAFRDDMNGKLGPLWSVIDNTGAANELSWRLAANVQAMPDRVSIVAQRQAAGGRQFTSGYITTAGKASWQFFRAIVRARCTDLYGLWPAPGWFRFDAAVGEIDAAEMVGTIRKVVQSVHQNNDGSGDHSGYDWPMPAGWSMADWHTYEVQRDNTGTITWRIDGVQTFQVTRAGLSTQMHQPMTWLTSTEFTGPAHLNINLQVGGSMPKSYLGASYDPTKILPIGTVGSLDIDYVQVLTPVATA